MKRLIERSENRERFGMGGMIMDDNLCTVHVTCSIIAPHAPARNSVARSMGGQIYDP